MNKKRWLAVARHLGMMLGNFAVVGFGLGIFQKNYDCIALSTIIGIISILFVLGGEDVS